MSKSKENTHKRTHEPILAVFPDTKEGNRALNALKEAASELKTTIEQVPFDRLDFGETAVLEKFYSANVVVVDVTERSYEATLFYQLGLREGFGMKHNVVTSVDQQSAYKAGRRSSFNPDNTLSPNTTNFGVRKLCCMCNYCIMSYN